MQWFWFDLDDFWSRRRCILYWFWYAFCKKIGLWSVLSKKSEQTAWEGLQQHGTTSFGVWKKEEKTLECCSKMNVVIFARKKSDRRIGRNARATTTGFVTGRSVETERPVMRNTKKWHAAKHAHSDEKTRAHFLAKKKRPKTMECCSKMPLGWFWWKLKSQNGEDVLDGTQRQQKAGFGTQGFVEAKRPSC